MSGHIPEKDLKIICMRSGNRCAYPGCTEILIKDGTEYDDASVIAAVAHIKGEKPGAARYDSNMTKKERNSHSNLILLCNNHHKLVDDQPNTYPADTLIRYKQEHENRIISILQKEIVNVTFVELSIVTKYLLSNQIISSETYTVIPPKEKIKKNDLSPNVEHLITMGLTQAKQVERFINNCPDIEFSERLRQGFVAEYERLKSVGIKGDYLFDSLLDFASARSSEFKNKAAGLAVLVYLFEKCDVFEK